MVTLSAFLLYRSGQASGDRWLAGLGAGMLAAQAALAVHGLTDAVTWGMVRSAPLVWAVWGLAVAGYRIRGLENGDANRAENAGRR